LVWISERPRVRLYNLLDPLDFHHGVAADGLERRGIALHPAEDVHRTGGADLIPTARRGRPEKDAEGAAGRPVAKVALLHHFARRLRIHRYRNRKVDLVPPGASPGLDG